MTPCTIARQASLSMGILQARLLDWVSMSFSRGSSQPRDWTQVFCIAGGFFTVWDIREALEAYKRLITSSALPCFKLSPLVFFPQWLPSRFSKVHHYPLTICSQESHQNDHFKFATSCHFSGKIGMDPKSLHCLIRICTSWTILSH